MGAHHVFTGHAHGDLAVGGDPRLLTERRAAVGAPSVPWVWLEQVHGADVVVAASPGDGAGSRADAVVTAEPGVVVAVHTADCAPVLIEGNHGLAVVHAGWKGLLAGVVGATVATMVGLGITPQRAVLGPVIRPRCYEFGPEQLDPLVERFGPPAAATTAWGTPAFDLPAAVAVALGEHGLAMEDTGTCTACSPHHWSHRARGDMGRQALVAWWST